MVSTSKCACELERQCEMQRAAMEISEWNDLCKCHENVQLHSADLIVSGGAIGSSLESRAQLIVVHTLAKHSKDWRTCK